MLPLSGILQFRESEARTDRPSGRADPAWAEWPFVGLAAGQVSPTARQLGPGLGLTGPPPVRVVPLMSQIEAWPLVF